MSTPRLVPIRDEHNQIAGFRRADEPEPAPPAAPAIEPSSPTSQAPAATRRSVAELLPDNAQAHPPRPPGVRPGPSSQPTAAAFVLGALLAVVALTLLSGSSHLTVAQPTTQSTTVSTPTAAPPTPTQPALTRAVVAYDAPRGAVMGALEPGRVYTTTARYETTWVRLEVQGSGPLWVQVAELGATVEPGLPDLAPTATPSPAPTAPPTPAPPQAPPAAAPPAAPVACTESNAPYRRSGTVTLGGSPVGDYRVWSCVSEAEVERQAVQAQEQIRADVQATQTAQDQGRRGAVAPQVPTVSAR